MPHVILGLGSGRSGTNSLASILSACRNVDVQHEAFRTDWYRTSDDGDERFPRIKSLDEQDRYFRERLAAGVSVGNVAFYLIPRWRRVRTVFPDCRIVCLHRPKEETVESWLKWTCGLSQCYPPDLPGIAAHPRIVHQAKWSTLFPKFEHARSSREAWELHWELCEREMAAVEDAFHLQLAELNDDAALARLFDYCRIPLADRVLPQQRRFNVLT
jgi:hypothetical protein